MMIFPIWTHMQQGHKLDVPVISFSDEDDNYGGLLECGWQPGGQISEKNTMSTMSVQGGFEPLVKPHASNFLISKSVDTVPITPILMTPSLSISEEAIHVSFIHFNGL